MYVCIYIATEVVVRVVRAPISGRYVLGACERNHAFPTYSPMYMCTRERTRGYLHRRHMGN